MNPILGQIIWLRNRDPECSRTTVSLDTKVILKICWYKLPFRDESSEGQIILKPKLFRDTESPDGFQIVLAKSKIIWSARKVMSLPQVLVNGSDNNI